MMMKPYSLVAPAYDYLLRHVDYDRWYRYLRSLIFRYNPDPHTILELGCGTGKFGAKFSHDDFDIYGIDISMEMLRVARSRAYKNFHILCGDIRNFHLQSTFDFIFSVHDTFNYLLRPADIQKAFRSVRGVMHPKSIFMFDITTEYNIKRFFDNRKTEHTHHGRRITWNNEYDRDRRMISSVFTVQNRDGTTRVEEHRQRIYRVEEIKSLLKKEGFQLLDIFCDYSFNEVIDEAIMINFVTRLK